ncbi:hypothetical protein FRB91_004563, partial [Serendipita sp. 411]
MESETKNTFHEHPSTPAAAATPTPTPAVEQTNRSPLTSTHPAVDFTKDEKKLRTSSDKESVHSVDAQERERELVAQEERDIEEQRTKRQTVWRRTRPFFLAGLALLILGWWISATVLEATRHRWIVQTLFAWFFIFVIAFRFLPNSIVVALFVLKTGAGQSIFGWIATLAKDFLDQGPKAAVFFFDQETINKHWFFVNVLSSIIFFIAFVQMLYYTGAMQWMIGKFAWFFYKTMNVSGAEAVVASASPWVGQGESACLVKPYVDIMTDSEIHLVMTSGFSTIAGSVLGAYIGLGVDARILVTSSVMSIPASISISKMRYPETDEPITRGHVVVDRGKEDKAGRPANLLHAFSRGAIFGLIVAGQIFANVLTILALVYTINGLLTWIGRGFGIYELTLQLIVGYLLYPLTFFMGVPRAEIYRVAQLLATKLVANEFVAYLALKAIREGPNPLSTRAEVIASYALCGFANLASLGIQIGVLSSLGPARAKSIARLAPSAMICGFLSTMQAA